MSDAMHMHAPDWRAQIRRNKRRTAYVIMLFVLIYLSLGFLIDLYLHYTPPTAAANVAVGPVVNTTLSQTALSLITLHTLPTVTFIMGIVAALSLLITFKLHNRIMLLGTQSMEVTATTTEPAYKQLYNVVEELKIAAGMHYMPRVYIINADYMNAFASGYSEKSAMVAITTGLLTKLNRAELQAVMAHELSHIRHADIKLTLMAAVLANLTLITIDVLFRGVIYSNIVGGGERRRSNNAGAVLVIMILRFVLPLITILLTLYLSRTRELMADAGSVELMRSSEPLGQALLKIHQDHTSNTEVYQHAYQKTAHEEVRLQAYLYDPSYAGISATHSLNQLFSSHPSLQTRLKALGMELKESKK